MPEGFYLSLPLFEVSALRRSFHSKLNQQTTELRYYLSSLSPDAVRAACAARGHWGVENSLHLVLDALSAKDDSRAHRGNAPENLTLVYKITHNLLQ